VTFTLNQYVQTEIVAQCFQHKERKVAKVTGLSGNEIYSLSLKNYTAGELVVGNSVNSMGFLGGMAAGFKGMAGGEITQVTQAIEEGRIKAFDRMIAESKAARRYRRDRRYKRA